MPHISIKLYPGRSKEELEKISKSVQNSLVETVGWDPNVISVSIDEIEAEKFVEKANEKIEGEKIIIPSNLIK